MNETTKRKQFFIDPAILRRLCDNAAVTPRKVNGRKLYSYGDLCQILRYLYHHTDVLMGLNVDDICTKCVNQNKKED